LAGRYGEDGSLVRVARDRFTRLAEEETAADSRRFLAGYHIPYDWRTRRRAKVQLSTSLKLSHVLAVWRRVLRTAPSQ